MCSSFGSAWSRPLKAIRRLLFGVAAVIISGMGQASSPEPETPERYLDRLGRRLNQHRLWNCLLGVFPPLLVLAYIVAVSFLFNWVSFGVLLFSTAAIVGVGLAVVLHFQTTLPEQESLGQLIDERVGGKEHFRTLATIDPARARPSMLGELRSQGARLLRRVNFKRDFPYRLRRGSACSLILSVLSIVILHFFLAHPVLSVPDAAALKQVPALAQQFARKSGLHGLARGVGQAAGDLQRKIKNTALVKKLVEHINGRFGSGSGAGQQSGQGQGSSSQNKSKTGAGNREQNSSGRTQQAPGNGPAGDKPDPARSGRAKSSDDEQDDRDPPRKDAENQARKSGAGETGERDDPEKRNPKDDSPEDQAKRKKGTAGSRKSSEDIPQGAEPDRFHPPGAEEEGVKGARFVTVALPKALSVGGGENIAGGEKGGSSKAQIPVSNVPLPPRTDPETVGEKQHMPLEYKGLIK